MYIVYVLRFRLAHAGVLCICALTFYHILKPHCFFIRLLEYYVQVRVLAAFKFCNKLYVSKSSNVLVVYACSHHFIHRQVKVMHLKYKKVHHLYKRQLSSIRLGLKFQVSS